MSFALSSGVTGLQAHQKMLDVAGNNLANVNSTAFKASRITFAELLSETIKKASQPTGEVGGTNPQQMGSGVTVSGISPNTTQGNIVSTGNPLDLAIEGEGYFVLSDGGRNIYTRAGAFAVDQASFLVDPATGYRIQRLVGSSEEDEEFQDPSNSHIRVPYDAAMPANATSNIVVSGNLSADAATIPEKQQSHEIASNIKYTADGGTPATEETAIDQLDQFSGTLGSGTITISGYYSDGTAFAGDLTFDVNPATTLGEFIDHLNLNVLNSADPSGATASLVNGQIVITDNEIGYSKTDMVLEYAPAAGETHDMEIPAYFEISTTGGEEVKPISITVYDSQGAKHVLSAAFVRTDTINTWDMVLTAITGDVHQITPEDRRIEGITFDANNGSYLGLSGSDSTNFVITFGHDVLNPQTIELDLGTVRKFDGLTQFAGKSTAVAKEQDGYGAGWLSSVSVDQSGIAIGTFSNGVKKNIATLEIALFQNPAGMENLGGGYFIDSANSGLPEARQAMDGGAGRIHGGALEKSNADVATEFVNLIQAQNGFQANARTIRVANEILRELSNLIR